MKKFSPEYRKAIESNLEDFIDDGDAVACIGYFKCDDGRCEMCGKVPITNRFVLENLNSHRCMIVGNECVQNYEIILSEWGYHPEFIVFPESLRLQARRIIQGNPHSIVFDDGTIMRSQLDCERIIEDNSQSVIRKHARFVRVEETPDGEKNLITLELGDDEEEEEEGDSELCGCSAELWYCDGCDNEMCPECGTGCTCDEESGFDYHEGVADEDDLE